MFNILENLWNVLQKIYKIMHYSKTNYQYKERQTVPDKSISKPIDTQQANPCFAISGVL